MNRSGHNTDRDRTADFSERWWPSPFGEDDEQGMLNHITEAKRREALALVREGRLYDLGHILDEQAPVFPGRYFRQTLATTAHQINADPGAPPPTGLGDNQANWITIVVAGTMQEGTHIDGLNHLQIGDRGYNGWRVARPRRAIGYQASRRGHDPADREPRLAVDVTAVRGVDQLRGGDVITTEDVIRHSADLNRVLGTLSCFTRAGAARGRTRTATWPASPDRALNSASGSLSEASRSPGVTPGAMGRCSRRIQRVRSRSPQTLNVRLVQPTAAEKALVGADPSGHPDRMPPAEVADRLSRRVRRRGLSLQQRVSVLNPVHYTFGAAIGVAYVGAARRWPAVARDLGVPAGLTICGSTHASALPMLRIQEPPWNLPMSAVLWEGTSHVVFGLALEASGARSSDSLLLLLLGHDRRGTMIGDLRVQQRSSGCYSSAVVASVHKSSSARSA